MHRTALPLAVAVAASLACPEVSAMPVRSSLAFRSEMTQPEEQPEAQPQPDPYAAQPAPQPYRDPSATAQPEGPQPVTYGPPPLPRSRRKGLMIAGWSMFGGSYLFTALIAGIVHDSCNALEESRCRQAAAFALIPLVGTFIAIPYMQTRAITPKVFMALPSLVQIAGFTMGIVGTVQFVNDGRAQQIADRDGFKLGKSRLRLNVGPTPFLDGGQFSLGARF